MEPTGLEPATSAFSERCTANCASASNVENDRGGIRTHTGEVGNLSLYQLSYVLIEKKKMLGNFQDPLSPKSTDPSNCPAVCAILEIA